MTTDNQESRMSTAVIEIVGKWNGREYSIGQVSLQPDPATGWLTSEDFLTALRGPSRIEKLIENSSLGTPEAKALRAQTPPGVARRIVQRAEALGRPLRQAAEEIAREHAAAVDAEHGCMHDVDDFRNGNTPPEWPSETFEPIPDGCPGLAVLYRHIKALDEAQAREHASVHRRDWPFDWDHCHEDTGGSDPCGKPPVGARRDPEEGHLYPVCRTHMRP